MISPKDCQNIGDIRQAIDSIDQNIVAELAKRSHYKAIVEIDDSIETQTNLMLIERKRWADGKGLDAAIIDVVFNQAPADCYISPANKAEVDSIDNQIITLLAKRYQYVQEAAKFKKTHEQVKAADRVASMLNVRKDFANIYNLDPELIASFFLRLVQYFITKEKKKFDNDQQ